MSIAPGTMPLCSCSPLNCCCPVDTHKRMCCSSCGRVVALQGVSCCPLGVMSLQSTLEKIQQRVVQTRARLSEAFQVSLLSES
jgi:hypothetical protein